MLSAPNETIYNYRDPNNLLAASLMAVIGVIGIVCNSIIIYVFCKNSSEKTAFNCISVTRAVSNFYVLVAPFGMIFVPTAILGYTAFFSLPTSSAMIANAFTLYALNDHMIVLVALNRFFAIYFPTKYFTFCGIKPTLIFITLIFAYHASSFIEELYLYWTVGERCWVYFSPYSLTWGNVEKCMEYNGLVEQMVVIFLVTTVFNLLTLWKVRRFYTKKTTNTSRAKEKKNIYMFFQTILQDFLFLIDLSFTFQFGGMINHRLWTFLSGTLIWECIHSIDGFIMVMFNERLVSFRNKFKATRRQSVVQVVSETIH